MNIEQELPHLLDELAAYHVVGPPPDVSERAIESPPNLIDRRKLLPLVAAAAVATVLIGGLVAIGSRNTEPDESVVALPSPNATGRTGPAETDDARTTIVASTSESPLSTNEAQDVADGKETVPCLASVEASSPTLPIRLEALPAACNNTQSGLLVVANDGTETCGSDINADLSSGERLWFESSSGYGGEFGRWVPIPDGIVGGTGIMEYPPGERSWTILLPSTVTDPGTITIPVTCGDQRFDLVAAFDLSQN